MPCNTYVEDHEDTDELGEAERHPELERGKGGDERGPALLDDGGDAADVDHPGGERRRHRGLRRREGDTWGEVGLTN